MISTQPIFSIKYFQFRKNRIPKDIKCLFYLSWEDSLWDILNKKNIKKGSMVLVPDFYCGDVEANIIKHGYRIAHYKINSNLNADLNSFVYSISKYIPEVIIIFHPVGIKSNLLDRPNWLIKITGNSILIEDAVHRALDAKDFSIIKKNHFIVDSLRKVVPIQGSRVYGRGKDLNFNVPGIFQSFNYSLKVNFLWFLMTLAWTLNFQKIAEKLMIKGYSLIGDSVLPARGSTLARFFSERLNITAIQNIKRRQVNYYEDNLKNIIYKKLKISDKDKKHLRGHPLILPIGRANKILKCLRNNGFLIRFELNDSAWSKKQKVIYLPLGVCMSNKQQIKVCRIIRLCLSKI